LMTVTEAEDMAAAEDMTTAVEDTAGAGMVAEAAGTAIRR
jgi:hypothetical protein